MTCKRVTTLTLVLAAALAGCGNYSNEDLEYMNAVPASEDISASIPRAIRPANEAELARLTHDTTGLFNGALDFVRITDVIRSFPPTSRLPNGRIWGPVPMDEHPGWQWRLLVTRATETPDRFDYSFDVQQVGSDPNDWITFISGWFVAVNGLRKGMGHLVMLTDELRLAGFPIETNLKDEMLKELTVDYSTETFPTSVTMKVTMYTQVSAQLFDTWFTIDIHYGALESGQGAIEFLATDSSQNSISVISRWLPTGRGRADATVTGGAVDGQTRTQCWNDSFDETYNFTPWASPAEDRGQMAACPDISTL